MALISNVVTGGTIASTWGNAVRDATVQVTTSAARPSSPAEGMVIWETDTDAAAVYTGGVWVYVADGRDIEGAWSSWTPTYTNLGAGTGGSQTAKYSRAGRRIHFEVVIDYGTSAPAITGQMRFTLPVAPRALFVCSGMVYAPSVAAGNVYELKGMPGTGSVPSSGSSTVSLHTLRLVPNANNITDIKWVQTDGGVPFTNPGTSDFLVVNGTYEAAS